MARDIPVDRIEPHPQNANVMAPEQMAVLRRHLSETGRYEPLIVRSLGPAADGRPRWQVLNGHHRLRVLRDLGHATARCEVWDVGDAEALMLLATLNRLEGRDDPTRRATLLAALADVRGPEGDARRLARYLPENRGAVERALELARKPLPAPQAEAVEADPLRPATFFLSADELATVNRALRAARQTNDEPGEPPPRGPARSAALVRIATYFLAAAAKAEPTADAAGPDPSAAIGPSPRRAIAGGEEAAP